MAEVFDSLIKALNHIEKASAALDHKAISTALRMLPSFRRTCPLSVCAAVVQSIGGLCPSWANPEAGLTIPQLVTQDSRGFILLLACMILMNEKRFDHVKSIATDLIPRLDNRTSQPILGKVYYYLALAEEKQGILDERPYMQWYRQACLRHDTYSQCSLINIILRIMLLKRRTESAHQFASKIEFPNTTAYHELARYHYYLGRINAVQLNYSDSMDNLTQAQRKAPENTGIGFKLAVQKLKVVVELLIGEIPSRKILVETKGMRPYLELVRAVKSGELERYHQAIEANQNTFENDMNLTLIARLRHIVIKIGLRRINIAYSAISLGDLAGKVGLPLSDTEYIVAKAIRDNVIEGFIDHEQSVLKSKPLEDAYTTFDPQQAISKRINFCMDLRNDAVRAMQPQVDRKVENPADDLGEPTLSDEEDDFIV